MRLKDKQTLVTGAASGIGKAVVEAFLAEGASVIAADISHDHESTRALENPRLRTLDVRNESQWERLIDENPELDVVVASAGISDAKPIAGTSLEDWRRVMSVNLDGAFLSVKYGMRAMQHKNAGAIVLVGSASGTKAAAGASAYCSSKAGLAMLVKVAALEAKPQAIRVNAVSPAGVVTPMWQKMPLWQELVEKHGSEQGAWQALGGNYAFDPSTPSIQRMARAEEIAAAVVFLSCDESIHITGANLMIDGGYTL